MCASAVVATIMHLNNRRVRSSSMRFVVTVPGISRHCDDAGSIRQCSLSRANDAATSEWDNVYLRGSRTRRRGRTRRHKTPQNLDGEFDPGSGQTLAACLTHASRTHVSSSQEEEGVSGGRVSNT